MATAHTIKLFLLIIFFGIFFGAFPAPVILSVKIDFFVKKCKFRPIISLRLPVFLSLFAVRNVKRYVKKLLT